MSGVDLLPAWPTSGDSEAAFNTKADALGPALSTMITQINTALGVTNISAWVSGAAYTAGTSVVWSLINFRPYRRKTTSSAGTTDPSLDTTNWAPVEPVAVDANGNVGIGSTPTTGQGVMQAISLTAGGAPAVTGTSDPNQIGAFKGASYQVSFGIYADGRTWIQGRDSSNFANARDLCLQPNGGHTLHCGSGGGLGYGAGAGGAVTQATSKTTGVVLHRPVGQITMHGAALAAGATAEFNVTNSLMNASLGDVIFASAYSFGGSYRVEARGATGSFYIRVTNITGSSLAEALIINFAIIKGVIA